MRARKAKQNVYAIAEELITKRGPCSIHELSDYIVSKDGKNVRWLPQRATISMWLRVNSAFYIDSNRLWHIK